MSQHTLDQPKTMIASKGYVILNAPGIASKPTIAQLELFASDITRVPNNGHLLGHTSRENLVSFGREGGDTAVLGSWEQEQLEQITTSKAVAYVEAKALQMDNYVLGLYHGGGDATQPGEFRTPTVASPAKASLTVVYVSRGQVSAQFYEHTSITGPEEIAHSLDKYSEVPLRFTVLDPLTQAGSRLVYIGRQYGAPVPSTPGGTTPTTPVVTGMTPSANYGFQGSNVTLNGTDLSGVTSVTMDTGLTATIVSKTATQLVFTIPATAAAGTNDIKLNYGGTTPVTVSFRVLTTAADTPSNIVVKPTLIGTGDKIYIEGTNLDANNVTWNISDNVVTTMTTSGTGKLLTLPAGLTGAQELMVGWSILDKSGVASQKFALATNNIALSVGTVSKASNPVLEMTAATTTGLTVTAKLANGTGSDINIPTAVKAGAPVPTVTLDYSGLAVGAYVLTQNYSAAATPVAYASKTNYKVDSASTKLNLTVTA